ncbi:MAG: transcription antitermination factor NusB [Patescibacteria group bacterium]
MQNTQDLSETSKIPDTRHSKRVTLVQQLYASTYDPNQVDFSENTEIKREFDEILGNIGKIDEIIKKHASKYPLENVAKTDLSILRLAVYELVFVKKEPPKVIINEAVELAKELGSDRSYAFVNGALGAILSDQESNKI